MTTYDFLVRTLSEKFDVPVENITPDKTLSDLDMDSLATVELLDIMQERCAAPIDDDEIGEAATLKDMADLLSAKQEAA
ncbi:acyl carrier protein [Streptomyces sp. NPDC023327]|uniref:acyl carrier protein n=1 Tax=Streptomyces sp. NPDC023327 TaxID=3157088 RepID=UPI0033C167ED